MSSGAEAQGLLCFQSLKSPALPTSHFPPRGDAWVAVPRAPASLGAGAEAGDAREGTPGRGRGGWVQADPLPAGSERRCRGS